MTARYHQQEKELNSMLWRVKALVCWEETGWEIKLNWSTMLNISTIPTKPSWIDTLQCSRKRWAVSKEGKHQTRVNTQVLPCQVCAIRPEDKGWARTWPIRTARCAWACGVLQLGCPHRSCSQARRLCENLWWLKAHCESSCWDRHLYPLPRIDWGHVRLTVRW